MELKKAYKIAVGICYLLQPFCEPDRLRIAGSVRRRKADVKDIEIVCLPLELPKVFKVDLFAGMADFKPVYERHYKFIQLVNNLGKIEKGKPTGRYCKINLPEGVALDLFIPEPCDFFRQFVIRTGSSDYVAKMIAGGWKRKGWAGTDQGLRLISECEEKKTEYNGIKKSSWKCIAENPTLPPVWQSEKEFFDFLGVEMIEPPARFFS